MAREITFIQYETKDNIAMGAISLELPLSLVEVGETVQYSINGKILPFYEGVVEFDVSLNDGTVTTLSGSLALWFDKKHTKAAIEAAKKAKEEAERARKQEEMRRKREELLKAFTDEQIRALAALGMLDKEGE